MFFSKKRQIVESITLVKVSQGNFLLIFLSITYFDGISNTGITYLKEAYKQFIV